MSVLVVGAGGQVGRHLQNQLPECVGWDRSELDLTNCDEVYEKITALQPKVIVNAGAYTAVDKAEQEPDLAWAVNAAAVAHLATAANAVGAVLIHYSTDYVFDGTADRPYREDDPVGPLNVYGRTKLAGELAASSICERYWILRISWVFSQSSANFVHTMLSLADRQELNIVNDQRGAPSYAGDIARATRQLIDTIDQGAPDWGTYHLPGGQGTTWYDFAGEIFHLAHGAGKISAIPELHGVSTGEYPTAARRPLNSRLQLSKALATALPDRPDWVSGLQEVIDNL